MSEGGDVLVFGYGNPGRLDDGLGAALADAIEELRIPGVDVDADYQLTVEDAAEVARHRVVVFADAAVDGPEPFSFEPVEPKGELGFTSHGLDAPAVMAFAIELFAAETKGYMLGIRGYEFNEFGEALSAAARENLAAAAAFLETVLRNRSFDEAAARAAARAARRDDEGQSCKTEYT